MINKLLILLLIASFSIPLFGVMSSNEGLIEQYLTKLNLQSSFTPEQKSRIIVMEGTLLNADGDSISLELQRIFLHPKIEKDIKIAASNHLRSVNSKLLSVSTLQSIQNIGENLILKKNIFRGRAPDHTDTNYIFLYLVDKNSMQLIGYYEQIKGANVEFKGSGDIKANKRK